MSRPNNSPTLALAMGTLAFGVAFAAWSLLSPIITGIQKDLGLSDFETSLLLAVPVILGSLLRIPLGIMTDRYGGRIVFTILLLLVIPALLILALATNFSMYVLGGLWLGLSGASFAVGVPFVSRHYPPAQQGFVLGVYGMGNIGTAVAARLAPQINQSWGRPAVFYTFIVIMLVMAAIFWLLARDAPAPANAPRPTMANSLTILQNEKMAWLFSLFYFVTFGGFVAFSLYLPKLLVDLYHYTPIEAGDRVFVFVVLATLARPAGGWLSDKIGGARILQAVFLVVIVAALTLTITTHIVPLTIACLVTSWFLGLGNGAVFKLVAQYFPGRTGTVTGIVGAAGGLGGFFPPILLGLVRQSLGHYTIGFALLALFGLLCFLLNQAITARQSQPGDAGATTVREL